MDADTKGGISVGFFKSLAKIARASNEKAFDRTARRYGALVEKMEIDDAKQRYIENRKCSNCKYYDTSFFLCSCKLHPKIDLSDGRSDKYYCSDFEIYDYLK